MMQKSICDKYLDNYQFAPQAVADGLDEVSREVGDIAQGLVLDLAVFAIATTQEVGLVDSALVVSSRGGYMHRSKTCCHDAYNTSIGIICQALIILFSGYIMKMQDAS